MPAATWTSRSTYGCEHLPSTRATAANCLKAILMPMIASFFVLPSVCNARPSRKTPNPSSIPIMIPFVFAFLTRCNTPRPIHPSPLTHKGYLLRTLSCVALLWPTGGIPIIQGDSHLPPPLPNQALLSRPYRPTYIYQAKLPPWLRGTIGAKSRRMSSTATGNSSWPQPSTCEGGKGRITFWQIVTSVLQRLCRVSVVA